MDGFAPDYSKQVDYHLGRFNTANPADRRVAMTALQPLFGRCSSEHQERIVAAAVSAFHETEGDAPLLQTAGILLGAVRGQRAGVDARIVDLIGEAEREPNLCAGVEILLSAAALVDVPNAVGLWDRLRAVALNDDHPLSIQLARHYRLTLQNIPLDTGRD